MGWLGQLSIVKLSTRQTPLFCEKIDSDPMNVNAQEPIIRHRKIPSHRKTNGLIRYASNKTSQSGEDGILQRIFDLISLSENPRNRWCVDVGAWDGKHLSNTYNLLTRPDSVWKGVLIEADQMRFQQLENLYESQDHNVCIHASVSCDPESSQSLPNLLDTYLLPHIKNDLESYKKDCIETHDTHTHTHTHTIDLDFVCIDIDGCDYWVLYDLLHHPVSWNEDVYYYRPLVLCIEFNPTIPHEIVYIPPRNDTIRHGCSLSALYELLVVAEEVDTKDEKNPTDINYVLVETTCYNAFFIRKDVFDLYITKEEVPHANDLEALHQITMGTKLYQLYDGTIKLTGCKKLLWHRIPMEEEKLQILKKQEERTFPFRPQS
jgi:hypothetical protein